MGSRLTSQTETLDAVEARSLMASACELNVPGDAQHMRTLIHGRRTPVDSSCSLYLLSHDASRRRCGGPRHGSMSVGSPTWL